MAEKRLVISIFDTEADADAAAAALKDTRATVDSAVAVFVLDKSGELKAHKTGTTSGGKGIAAGAVFGLLGPVGLGIGVLGGGLLGKLHHKNLGLDDASRERISAAPRGGKAAVGVLAGPEELIAVHSRRPRRRNRRARTRRGGTPRGHRERLTCGHADRRCR